MGYPVTLNGRTYTLADFEGLNYVSGFPDALEDFVTEAGDTITAAEAAQTAAEVAQAAAEAALDAFDDRFLGTKSSDPTLDNDGNALTDGALYFDTTNNVMKVYDLGNTEWKTVAPSAAQQTNIDTVATNISDVTSVAGSISNVNTVATNLSDVNNFAETYRIAASDPTTSLDEGDLVFNTTDNKVKVYNGSAWQDVAPVATSVTVSQISDLTATAAEINVLDGIPGTLTATEIGYLDGVTSAIQTQLDAKGTVSSLSDLGVTATSTELNYVDGVTSAIQTQLDAKAAIANPTFTTGITSPQVDITAQGDLRLQDSSGGQYVALQAPATISSNYTLTMPSADGTADQVLKTNGSGVLSFGDAGGGGAYVYLEGGTVGGVTNLDIDLPSGYEAIHIIFQSLSPSTARRFEAQMTQNAFSSVLGVYRYQNEGAYGSTQLGDFNSGGSYINFFTNEDVAPHTSSNAGINGHVYVFNGQNDGTGSRGAQLFASLGCITDGNTTMRAVVHTSAQAADTGLINGIRFRFEGATNAIERGRYQVYGLTQS